MARVKKNSPPGGAWILQRRTDVCPAEHRLPLGRHGERRCRRCEGRRGCSRLRMPRHAGRAGGERGRPQHNAREPDRATGDAPHTSPHHLLRRRHPRAAWQASESYRFDAVPATVYWMQSPAHRRAVPGPASPAGHAPVPGGRAPLTRWCVGRGGGVMRCAGRGYSDTLRLRRGSCRLSGHGAGRHPLADRQPLVRDRVAPGKGPGHSVTLMSQVPPRG